MVFAVWLKWLPIGLSVPIGVETAGVTIQDRLVHAVLPVLTLSVTGISNIALHTREKMIQVMESDNVNVFLDEISREEMAAYVEMHSPVAVFRLV